MEAHEVFRVLFYLVGRHSVKIAVIDGQGGGIGRHITEALRRELPESVKIFGLGTNSIATGNMIKGGANEGATGENALVWMTNRVDLIVGTVAILTAGSMCGEVTPKIAAAVGMSPATKLLLPINKSNVQVVGVVGEPVPHQIEKLVNAVLMFCAKSNQEEKSCVKPTPI